MKHLKLGKLVVFIFLGTILSSCANHYLSNKQSIKIVKIPFASPNQFLPRPIIIESDQILNLSNEHKVAIDNYFYKSENSSIPPNKRLSQYLENYVGNYFYYNQTLTANESLENSKGNCLSLAILTTAFANHLGIDIGYQLVDSTPVYQEENGIGWLRISFLYHRLLSLGY